MGKTLARTLAEPVGDAQRWVTSCYHCVMVRTQIQLEESQYEQIRRMAHRERISMAEAVRRLVRRGLAEGESDRPTGAAALLSLAGIASSGLGDLGRRHDDYLAEDLSSELEK